MSKSTILKPRVSEKGYALSEQTNTYVFDIGGDTNKHLIAQAVTVQFEVKVENVRIAGVPGKPKRAYKKRGRNMATKRSDIRKAYVTLAEGSKLPFFDAAAEEVKPGKETK